MIKATIAVTLNIPLSPKDQAEALTKGALATRAVRDYVGDFIDDLETAPDVQSALLMDLEETGEAA